jgi:tagatose 1,6-diphosphate aldolase
LRLSTGKQRGLQALANNRGVIGALAIDQRSALRKLFANVSGQQPENVSSELLVEFKKHVSHTLTPHASAILLDPEYGLPAAALRHRGAGLLLASIC